jgi:septum formation protein
MHQSPSLVRTLVLGSTSRYRRELLQRLGLPFTVAAPDVDETPLQGEAPRTLALRLALAKARAVAALHPDAVVIGSDQVADLHGQPLGKPGTHERASAQLQCMSGETVVFQTAVAVVCAATGFEQVDLAPVEVRFRTLTGDEIERYLHALSNPTTAPAAPRAKAWASACWMPSTATTLRPWSACP